MCGIAGYVGSSPLPDARLDACQRLMRRRGPDGEGRVTFSTPDGRYVHLLHSRLAILDPDPRADQPFQSGCTTLVFNGEIYNYRELRHARERQGDCFVGTGDTEVLAKLLDAEGVSILTTCEGMFALAAFDSRSGQLLLARDRFGEKPLWLIRRDNAVYFGSEPKFLFALLGRTLPIDRGHVRRYLVNGYKSLYKTKSSFFEGLEELPAGHVGIVEPGGNWREYPYWRPVFSGTKDELSFDEAVAGTRERLIRSMELRLRADVPIAFCLSGGVDSNALISVAKRALNYDVHGFTIVNTDVRYEERDMVDASVKSLALKHTPISIETTDFLPRLRTLIRQHDAPVYTITYYAQWQLMEAIGRDGYKVSVSGTGADELFSGYFDHHNAYLAQMADSDRGRFAEALAEWRKFVAPLVRNPYLQDPDLFVKRPLFRDHIYLDAAAFSEILVDPFSEPFAEINYTDQLLRNRMANELLHESVPVILHEDDLNAMYYSIENRSPFLDTELFNYCQRIPTRHLVKRGRAKSVLREAVRGIAPDVVIDNPRKVGFNAPVLDYLDVGDDTVSAELLADGPIWELVRRDAVVDLLKQTNLPNSRSKFLFNFVNAKLFLEEFSG